MDFVVLARIRVDEVEASLGLAVSDGSFDKFLQLDTILGEPFNLASAITVQVVSSLPPTPSDGSSSSKTTSTVAFGVAAGAVFLVVCLVYGFLKCRGEKKTEPKTEPQSEELAFSKTSEKLLLSPKQEPCKEPVSPRKDIFLEVAERPEIEAKIEGPQKSMTPLAHMLNALTAARHLLTGEEAPEIDQEAAR